MDEKRYIHSLDFIVRDYECDVQGVVNNANYQHFLEHARHDYLLSKGIDFIKLHEEGTDLIVVRIEIDYKFPLRSMDKFVVKSFIEREGNIKVVFYQDIYRKADNKLIINAKVTTAAVKNGRPIYPDMVVERLFPQQS